MACFLNHLVVIVTKSNRMLQPESHSESDVRKNLSVISVKL